MLDYMSRSTTNTIIPGRPQDRCCLKSKMINDVHEKSDFWNSKFWILPIKSTADEFLQQHIERNSKLDWCHLLAAAIIIKDTSSSISEDINTVGQLDSVGGPSLIEIAIFTEEIDKNENHNEATLSCRTMCDVFDYWQH